jgi:hypothetical protein
MTAPWSRREAVATIVAGGIAALFLRSALAATDAASAFWNLGGASSFVALALSPQVLFERISVERLKIHGPMFFGSAAFACIVALACEALAVIIWAVHRIE